jgi:hypothetical protein
MSDMHVLDRTGHTKITWTPGNDEEVDNARDMFNDLTRNNRYRAFRAGEGDAKGRRVDRFDPEAGTLIMVPHIAGG